MMTIDIIRNLQEVFQISDKDSNKFLESIIPNNNRNNQNDTTEK